MTAKPTPGPWRLDSTIYADLVARLAECVEYIDEVTAVDPEDGYCGWPNVSGISWCSALCKEHGCAKSRTYSARAALARAKGEKP